MNHICIDIETYSSADLKKSGVYRYTEAADFEILLFAYSVDGGAVCVVDLKSGERIPQKILDALTDDAVEKWAHNAMFERVCLSRHLGKSLSPAAWRCTMVWVAYMGLPLSLESAGEVLGLEKQKLAAGKDLIRYFCKPCKPTKVNDERTRNLPKHAPDKWAAFKDYNKQDVAVEMAIQAKLAKFPVPDNIWEEYQQDQEINDRGVAVDMVMVNNAIAVDERINAALLAKMRVFTGLSNPNSVEQLRGWLVKNGLKIDSLGKDEVKEHLKMAQGAVREVLLLRQQIAKTSVKKYQAMQNCVCADGRVRGMFQFYGANRTGRWAGRLIQLHNLPRNFIPDLADARALVRQKNYAALEMLYRSVPDVLSQLIRTAFVPETGRKLVVADFSSIERVVLAWLAKEWWVLEAYNAKQDLYSATASQMFKVPLADIDKKSPLRQRGKVADLACGYGGSVGALINMGALEQGLSEDELKPLVDTWRKANPKIVSFWYAVDRAASEAVSDKTSTETHGIKFSFQSGMLFIRLPSGRRLAYVKPRIGINRFDMPCVEYMGIDDVGKWGRVQTYGAKLVENIVQAISRDLLAFAMATLRHCDIVASVHDEVVLEADPAVSVEAICQQMSRIPSWAAGLTLRVEGFECEFYQKD